MQKRNLLLTAVAVIIVAAIITLISRSSKPDANEIVVPVMYGPFKAIVFTTGQLQAENSISIDVPAELSGRRVGIYEIKVTQLIEEGTVVDSGDFVAALDHSAVETILNQAKDNLEKALRSLDDAKIDTNINLSNVRDELLNSKVALEEKRLIQTQSAYESPAVQRQVTLDLEKAQRQLEQDLRNYKLKKRQDEFKMDRFKEEVVRQEETVAEIQSLFEAINVKASQPGMVIYGTDRFGNKIKVGSTVSRWAPQIATLPDMSQMTSITFVNEIDISRLKPNQKVTVGIDAFPDKKFEGIVKTVANIGQVLPDGDAKVFEVTIKVLGTDKLLRPAMTTSNSITTDVLDSVTYIPIDAIFKNDSLQYVFVKKEKKWSKQIIKTGIYNENFATIVEGLTAGEQLLLTEPTDANEMPYQGLDIYEKIKKENAELEAKNKKMLQDSIKSENVNIEASSSKIKKGNSLKKEFKTDIHK